MGWEAMKVVAQIAVVAVLTSAGGAGWYFRDAVLPGQQAKASATAAPAQRAIPIEAQKVRIGPIDDTVEAVGTALANESITVTTKISGIVKAIKFTEGQVVKAGTIILELDDREPSASLEAAKATREQAKAALDRAKMLLTQGNAPQARVDDLEGAYRNAEARVRVIDAQLADLKITAPFPGKLGIRRVSPGSLVSVGTVITTLDDVETIKLRFYVPEAAIGSIKPGSGVAASGNGVPGRTFSGAITSIDTRVDTTTRAIEVRAEFANDDGLLKPGMFLTVKLALNRRDGAMIVPEEAVVPEGIRQYVYIVADGKAVKTEVKLGARLPGEVEIREGLKPDSVVVTSGIQKIRDGSLVRTGA
ncbi:MAG: efflux RND transporter periplasmic adaptor subunit [Alphaproteobacteria bacterium]|nr:efflux RND transporter periplasmic adaptor subunit [Alphaproteobacteria bacterium]